MNEGQVGITESEAVDRFASMFAPQPAEAETGQEDALEPEEGIELAPEDAELDDEVLEDEQELLEATEDDGEPLDDDGEEPGAYTVRVDGQEFEVPLPELIAGYQRQSDYTRKTQAVAGQRKTLDIELNAMRQERGQYAAVLPQLEQVIQMGVGQEPREEQYSSRADYLYAKDQFATQMQQLGAIQQERARVHQQQVYEQEQQIAQWRESQAFALKDKLPEWSDQKVQTKEQGNITDYARAVGFSDEELATVFDHRMVLVLRDAMKFRQLQSTGRRKAKKAKTKAASPGSGDSGIRSRPDKALRERAASGTVDDIAPLMGQLLTKGHR